MSSEIIYVILAITIPIILAVIIVSTLLLVDKRKSKTNKVDTTKNKLKSSFWQRLLTNFKIKRATNFATECNIIKNTPEEINKYKNGLKKEFLQTRSIKNR